MRSRHRGQPVDDGSGLATKDLSGELDFKARRVPKEVANAASRRILEPTGTSIVADWERNYFSGPLMSVSGRRVGKIREMTAAERRNKRERLAPKEGRDVS